MFVNHPRRVARIGLVGCSCRCAMLLQLLLKMPDVRITALCDLYPDRTQAVADRIREAGGAEPPQFTDYRELLRRRDVDGVIIATSWASHCAAAIAAMRAGKYAAVECGGGSSIDELWQLVRAYEETGVPCMALENCCYDKNELTILNMIQQGVFGEILHAEGGYGHDLREEIANGRENRHYRLDNYLRRCGELYPGHAVGPMSKYLRLNRGNRMLTLVSMASAARGMPDYVNREKPGDPELSGRAWAEGDIVQTLVKCAGGETMLLTHDTTLPRYYSRLGSVRGTKGMWTEDGGHVFFDGRAAGNSFGHKPEAFAPCAEKYEHPLWKALMDSGFVDDALSGHGAMDQLVLRAFVESMLAGTDCPTDVYDAASWMAVTVLSEQSAAMGSMPVAVPDFTNGRWLSRAPYVRSRYCLDEVCWDLF